MTEELLDFWLRWTPNSIQTTTPIGWKEKIKKKTKKKSKRRKRK